MMNSTTLTWDAVQTSTSMIAGAAIVFAVLIRSILFNSTKTQLLFILIGTVIIVVNIWALENITLIEGDFSKLRYIPFGIVGLLWLSIPIISVITQRKRNWKLYNAGKAYQARKKSDSISA